MCVHAVFVNLELTLATELVCVSGPLLQLSKVSGPLLQLSKVSAPLLQLSKVSGLLLLLGCTDSE